MTLDEFNSFDFGTFASPVQSFPENLGNLQPLQPNPNPAYQAGGAQQNPYAVSSSEAGDRRPSDVSGPHRSLNFEEQSRMAAEEDKRRRNTAASARFRVKKKAREQALEKREKELADEVTAMKNRITHLETENKWLRGLVMEKAGAGKDSKFDAKLSAFLKSMGRTSESDSEEEATKKLKARDAEKGQ